MKDSLAAAAAAIALAACRFCWLPNINISCVRFAEIDIAGHWSELKSKDNLYARTISTEDTQSDSESYISASEPGPPSSRPPSGS